MQKVGVSKCEWSISQEQFWEEVVLLYRNIKDAVRGRNRSQDLLWKLSEVQPWLMEGSSYRKFWWGYCSENL